MDVYRYHPTTKVFLGKSTARPNPLEKGKFLIPANSTTKKVISIKEGEEEAWFDGEWNKRKIKTKKPSKYHVFSDIDGWSISDENQLLLDAAIQEGIDKAQEEAEAKEIKDAELAVNPFANMTLGQADPWAEINLTDLPSMKEAINNIIKLLITRT